MSNISGPVTNLSSETVAICRPSWLNDTLRTYASLAPPMNWAGGGGNRWLVQTHTLHFVTVFIYFI